MKDKVYTPNSYTPEELPSKIVAGELVSTSFNSQLNQILGAYSFGQLGAIQIGKYLSGVSGDVKISPSGIVARNSSNLTTFSLNGDTGDAYFAGTLKVGVQIETGALVVGTNVGLGTAKDAAGVTTIIGNTVTTGFINALNVTANSVNANWVYAGNIQANQIQSLTINASQITAGTITVGGTNQPTALIIQESSLNGNARLGWQHGSRMWEDSSSRLGINSIGSPMYIYVNSSERIIIPSSGQTTIRDGLYCNGNLNVTGDMRCNKITMSQSADEANIENVNIIKGYNDINFQLGNDGYRFSFYNTNYDEKAYINSAGKFHSSSSQIQLNGTDKTAIVPTSQGYKALYCAESPEVWFFDFCANTLKESIDPLFLEVTEGPYKFIQLTDGGYQIWGKRKGHAHKRFEFKTALQFHKNEEFLQLAKC